MASTAQQLLAAAEQSGLLSAAHVADLTRQGIESGRTAEDLASQLVKEQVLTAYQAEQLLVGQGEQCVLTGRYQLLERLGAGAMGQVYRARDTTLDRVVAIKVMAPQHVRNLDAVARFHREAKALAKVSHPGIVQAYDAGHDGDRHFLVMEFVDGTSLSQALHAHGRVSPALAADYIYQAALGLHHAHERGLIHRDLKPGNLLLSRRGEIKILDLGLARFVQDQLGDPQLTREGAGLGTPDYMAPEQFGDARHVDHRADIYALGCTLYHLLTGAVPFPGSSLSEKATAHEAAEPPAIETLAPDVPAGLILSVQRMMAKQPAERFQSAAEVAEALAVHVAGSSGSLSEIRATTSWQGSQLSFVLHRRKTQIQPRRKRWLVAGGVAAVLALAVAGVLMLPGWLAPEQTQESNGSTGSSVPALPAPDPNVLTVSKDAKDGGQFRTINEALEKVKPRQTIRVLDDAKYHEAIHMQEAERLKGVTLEASKRATIEAPPSAMFGIVIAGMSQVSVQGFRVVSARDGVLITGNCSDVRVDGMEFIGSAPNTRP